MTGSPFSSRPARQGVVPQATHRFASRSRRSREAPLPAFACRMRAIHSRPHGPAPITATRTSHEFNSLTRCNLSLARLHLVAGGDHPPDNFRRSRSASLTKVGPPRLCRRGTSVRALASAEARPIAASYTFSPASKWLMNSSFGKDPTVLKQLGEDQASRDPDEAKARGLADGARVRIGNRTGVIRRCGLPFGRRAAGRYSCP